GTLGPPVTDRRSFVPRAGRADQPLYTRRGGGGTPSPLAVAAQLDCGSCGPINPPITIKSEHQAIQDGNLKLAIPVHKTPTRNPTRRLRGTPMLATGARAENICSI